MPEPESDAGTDRNDAGMEADGPPAGADGRGERPGSSGCGCDLGRYPPKPRLELLLWGAVWLVGRQARVRPRP